MSYSAMFTLSQLTILSTISGGSYLTTNIIIIIITSCITIRTIDIILTIQTGISSIQSTSLALKE
jgi:hypothetical protein